MNTAEIHHEIKITASYFDWVFISRDLPLGIPLLFTGWDTWGCFPIVQWAEKLDREPASHGCPGSHYTVFSVFCMDLRFHSLNTVFAPDFTNKVK